MAAPFFYASRAFTAMFQMQCIDGANQGFRGALLIKRNGRSDRIRTCDVLLPKQVLYQAELRSDSEIHGQTVPQAITDMQGKKSVREEADG